MPSAKQVAKTYLDLAASGPEADPISNLRLQKLLYYAQGWSLAQRGVALFPDKIEAWALGPVVPNVYHPLKSFGAGAIPADAIDGTPLGEKDADFVTTVWDAYKG